ncbi:MAG: anthranilate synthase component I, partial [Actinomycetota bacterium]|nr:anthranilate synthase component I [Actinomycetota bacterium]
MPRPSREDFRALARTHTVVPVWREVLGDLITPVAAFARVVGEGPGFLLESVEQGVRWSRFSFIGRNPLATLVARHGRIELEGTLPSSVPLDRGVLSAIEAVLDAYRSPALVELPPLHGGLVGYLGYDVVREVEHLPDAPGDDQGVPDALLSVIGQLAVFDHWRQRVTLIDNVIVGPDATDDELDAAYDGAVDRVDALAVDGARPTSEPVVDPPDPGDALPEVRSTMAPGVFCKAVEVAKEHILDG